MPSARAYGALVIGVVATSWSPIFITWAGMPGPATAFYRLLLASCILWPIVLFTHKRLPDAAWRAVLLAAAGGAFFAADLSLYSTAVLSSSAANATVLGNNSPIVVGFLAWIFGRNRLRVSFWAGLTIALAGSILIVGADLRRHAAFGRGDLLALAASACFAVYLFVTERMRGHFDTTVLLALSLAGSTASLFVFNLSAGVNLRVPSARSWLAIVALTAVCQLAGYFCLTYALGHLSAGVTSVTLLAQAPITAVLALLLLRQPVTAAEAAGGLLVLLGVWAANR